MQDTNVNFTHTIGKYTDREISIMTGFLNLLRDFEEFVSQNITVIETELVQDRIVESSDL